MTARSPTTNIGRSNYMGWRVIASRSGTPLITGVVEPTPSAA